MKKLLSIGLVGLCSVTLVACGGNSDNSKSETKKENSSTENVKVPDSKNTKAYLKDDTLKIEMATLKILSTEVLPADSSLYRDKPQLAFTYEVTNDSEEPISASSVWIACFQATQDGENTINKLDVGMTPQDEKFNEFKEHQNDDIKPGGTVKDVIAYDLDDTTSSVVLKATQGISGSDLGEKKIELK